MILLLLDLHNTLTRFKGVYQQIFKIYPQQPEIYPHRSFYPQVYTTKTRFELFSPATQNRVFVVFFRFFSTTTILLLLDLIIL